MHQVASERQSGLFALAFLCVLLAHPPLTRGADLDEAQHLADTGQYEEALTTAEAALQGNVYFDGWHLLKGEVELTLGQWEKARQTVEDALARHPTSIRLRWLARDVYRRVDDPTAADQMLREILRLTQLAPRRYLDSENLVTLGHVALEIGIDPKEALKAFYERAGQANPAANSAPLAIGHLALEKHDFKLAAETFRTALERFPDDADILYGMALAVRRSDPEESAASLVRALKANPRHIPSLLLLADQKIDAEDYAAATETLEEVLTTNPSHDEAHAYLAVIAHLQNSPERETFHRDKALSSWSTNPRVDFLIGRELSQKYRFAEGLAAQRRAMDFDASYLPARRQAAEDLLRLGKEEEGWELVAAVHKENQYDVAAFNLVTLRDEMAQFATLEDETFLIRMDANEARIYGERVLALLNRARDVLCRKYGLDLSDKVTVEIFPDPADFQVRTFGMPGIPGFLGVCFGKVITANSPASQAANPSSWEAVLWHEFCHVVTLQLTRNRMPRWLSEGISVYEERLADARWGQPIKPRDRQQILDGKLTPIHDLSSAFHDPKSPGGIAFAYLQSSLVVEFLVETYGFEALRAVMTDLAAGLPINESLPRHTADWPELETGFVDFARARANALAPDVTWSTDDLPPLLPDTDHEAALRDWLTTHPTNFPALATLANVLMENEKWNEARLTVERMHKLYPQFVGEESPLLKLAAIARRLEDAASERDALEQYAALDPDTTETFLRLIELARESGDREALERNADRLMGVNPLTRHPHEALATVAEERGDSSAAVTAYRSLLALAPDDPSLIHYQLATHLAAMGEEQSARRHVLQALENAPRYRDGQRLLLELVKESAATRAE